MPRRRSSSNATRIVQVIVALVWLVFLFYIVSGYFKKPDPNTIAASEESPAATNPEGELANNLLPPTTTPLPTAPNAKSFSDAPGNLPNPGPTANEIIQRMKQAYRSASAYSDNAKLSLSFSLNGRPPIGEEYSWSTAWQKSTGQSGDLFASNIFDVRLRSDGNLLSCYVFESDSQNLDEQQLFLRTGGSLPLANVWADPIANYYLNGGERVPINETTVPNRNLLLPPAVTLVSAQGSLPWFTTENQYKLNGTEIIDNAPCHVLQSTSPVGNAVLWIDKSSFMLRKLKLPNGILAADLAANPAVTDLELSAKFTNASFTPSPSRFAKVTPAPGSRPVKKFVSIVDGLPTNQLGQRVSRFSLSDERQQPVPPTRFTRQQTVWLWLDNHSESPKLIEQFQGVQREVKASASGRNTDFVIVIGRGGIESTAGGRNHVTRILRPAINRLQGSVTTLYDVDGLAEKALEIRSTPAVLITDPNLTIQYASELSESSGFNGISEITSTWPEQLAAASLAVASGKNVANSMLENYGALLNRYFADMEKQSVASWFPGFTPASRRSIAAIPAKTDVASAGVVMQKPSSIKLRPTLLWESSQIRHAGNVFPLMDSNGLSSLMVFDGWQTIRQFSPEGKLTGQKALDIPTDQAVTSWRNVRSKSGETLNAFYSIGGPRVWIFDKKMQSKFTIPAIDEEPAKVLDIQVIRNAGDDDKLVVSFESMGQVMINPFSGKSQFLDRNPVRSSAVSGQTVAQIGIDGSLVGRTQADPSPVEYMHLVPALGRGVSQFAAAGISERGQWLIAGFDRNLRKQWEYSIGAVRFGNGTQPVTSAAAPSGDTIWSVADENNRIYCLDAEGNWLGDFDAGAEVRGLRLVSHRDKLLLVVAMASKIECWDLQLR